MQCIDTTMSHFSSFSVSTQDRTSADLSSHTRYKCDLIAIAWNVGGVILKEYSDVMALSRSYYVTLFN